MKNWYKIKHKASLQKTASMTLRVSGISTQDLTRIFDLCWELKRKIGNLPIIQSIDLDGKADMYSPTGMINFYLDPKSTPQEIEELKSKILTEASGLNVEGNLGEVETWKDKILDARDALRYQQNNPEATHEDIERISIYITQLPPENAPRVIRFLVYKNNNQVEDRPPEVNMANSNSFYIFQQILKYDQDLWENGEFKADELKKRCQYFLGETEFKNPHLEKKEIQDQKVTDLFKNPDSGNADEVANLLSGSHGISAYEDQKVRAQLNRIISVCDWAINNGYNLLFLS